MTRDRERIGIVGLGAIGGSLALALRDRQPLIAWSRDAADRAAARAAGIHVGTNDQSWPDELAGSTVVVIAVPLDDVAGILRRLLATLPDESLILHASSLQRREALGLSEAEFARVLGTHPIAGSERSGFGAADSGRFRGATVRAEARATHPQRRRIEMVWRTAGIERIAWSDAEDHDALMAWVSHLPQLASTALAAVLTAEGIARRDAGPGARDLTRLASSDLSMWAPILRHAPPATAEAVRSLTATLAGLAEALERGDQPAIEHAWMRARAWRGGVETPT